MIRRILNFIVKRITGRDIGQKYIRVYRERYDSDMFVALMQQQIIGSKRLHYRFTSEWSEERLLERVAAVYRDEEHRLRREETKNRENSLLGDYPPKNLPPLPTKEPDMR